MKKLHPRSMYEPMVSKPVDEKVYPKINIPIEQIPELKKKAPGDSCVITLELKVTGVRTGKGHYNNVLDADITGYQTGKEYSRKKNNKEPRYSEDEE